MTESGLFKHPLSPEMKTDFSSLFRRDAPQNGRLWFEAWVVVLELSKRHCRNTDNETAKHSRIGIGARLQNVKVAIFQVFVHASLEYILNRNHMPDISVMFKAWYEHSFELRESYG